MRRLQGSRDPWEQLGLARSANREEVNITIITIITIVAIIAITKVIFLFIIIISMKIITL